MEYHSVSLVLLAKLICVTLSSIVSPGKAKEEKKETQEKEKKRERILVINLCLKEAITKISSSYKVETKRHAF